MKCTILHETRGRMRVHTMQGAMSLQQADILEAYLNRVSGVTKATVYDRTGDAVICYDGPRETVTKALSSFAYAKEQALAPEHSSRALNRDFEDKLVASLCWRGIKQLFVPSSVRTLITVARSVPYIKAGMTCLMHRKIQVPVLDATAITVSMLRKDFKTASSIMFLLGIGDILDEWTHKKSVADLAQTMSLNVDKVWKETDAGSVLVPVADVQVGDRIVIHTGNVIPLDGKVVSGEAMVNQASITGEPLAVRKAEGGYVYAGTVVEEGDCTICVEKSAGSGRYDRIIRMIEESEKLKSATEDHASHLADQLVPYSLGATALVWLLTGNMTKALAVLMVDFSCALKLSMPIAVLSAMKEASDYHLSVKGGRFLEAVSDASTIVFDKTGTLTKGEPEVAGITLLGGADRKQVLSLAASLGAMNKHPLSAAIVREAKKEHAEIQPVADFTALPGEGVTGRIGTGRASLLNLAALDKRGLSSDEVADAFNRASENGMSSVALADTFGVLAVFVMANEIKADTRSGLAQLKAEGITPWLLTGDNERAAHALAGKLGLENVNADLLPEAKLARIRELQGQGLTAMVGDGINDAPALAQADIGIAMGVRGTDSAIEAADIAVMDDRISSVATLVRLSRMTHSVLVQNIAFALGIKIIFTILAISGFATMWMAVFADTGTCLIVVANGMRLMRVKPKLDRMAAEVDRAAGTAPQTHVQTAAA